MGYGACPRLVVCNYQFLETIGHGSYGKVWLCKHVKGDKQYVLKQIDVSKLGNIERRAAILECRLLSKLSHPNIVTYKDSFENGGFLYIAMGYCEGGDLYTRLRQQKNIPVTEKQLVEWFIQISIAIQYMHERNILHRDLKTQNVFLTRSNIVKVGDLGIAKVLESSNSMATTLIGTPYYMSPELFANKPYNHKSDIWALGCVLYEMATLKHAFSAENFNALSYKIMSGKIPEMPNQYSSEVMELLRMMLHQNPEKRPSARKILRNSFIRKHIVLFLESTKDRCSKSKAQLTLMKKAKFPFNGDIGLDDQKTNSAKNVPQSVTSTSLNLQDSKAVTSVQIAHEVPGCYDISVTLRQQKISLNESTAVSKSSDTSLPSLEDFQHYCDCHSRDYCASVDSSSPTSNQSPTNDLLIPPRSRDNADSEQVCNLPDRDTVQLLHLNPRQRRRERRRLHEFANKSAVQVDSAALVRKIVLQRQHLSVPEEELRMDEASNEEVGTQAHKDRLLLANRLPTLRQVSCHTKFPFSSVSIPPCPSMSIYNPHQCVRSHTNSTAILGNVSVLQSLSPLGDSSHSKESSTKLGDCVWENMPYWTEVSVPEDSKNDGISALHFVEPVNDLSELRTVVDRMTQTINQLPECISTNHPGAPLERRGVHNRAKDSEDSLDKVPYHLNHVHTIPNTSGELKTVGLSESIEETLGRTVRLKERFSLLHRECTSDVGLDKLRQVYGIIDRDINVEKQEILLKQLLGTEIYSRYMGKIWQLKLFEEHLLDQ